MEALIGKTAEEAKAYLQTNHNRTLRIAKRDGDVKWVANADDSKHVLCVVENNIVTEILNV